MGVAPAPFLPILADLRPEYGPDVRKNGLGEKAVHHRGQLFGGLQHDVVADAV